MGAQEQSPGEGVGIAALHRAKSEWRKLLTPEQYTGISDLPSPNRPMLHP